MFLILMIGSPQRGYLGGLIMLQFLHHQCRAPKVATKRKRLWGRHLHFLLALAQEWQASFLTFYWWELVTWSLLGQECGGMWSVVLGWASVSQHAFILWKRLWISSGHSADPATDVNPTQAAQRERNGANAGEATNHVSHTGEPGLDVTHMLICAEADVWALHWLLD